MASQRTHVKRETGEGSAAAASPQRKEKRVFVQDWASPEEGSHPPRMLPEGTQLPKLTRPIPLRFGVPPLGTPNTFGTPWAIPEFRQKIQHEEEFIYNGRKPESFYEDQAQLANNYAQIDFRYGLLLSIQGVNCHTSEVKTAILKRIKRVALRNLYKAAEDVHCIFLSLEASNLGFCSNGRDGNYASDRHPTIINQRIIAQNINEAVKDFAENVRKADY